jgi:hypothetical protein
VLLPREAARGGRPRLEELAKKDDAAEVVGVVGGERDELVAHGHDADGSAGAGWAADRMVETAGVLGGSGGLFGSEEKTSAELFPYFFVRFGRGFLGEAVGGFVGVGGFDTGDPV